MPFGAFSNPTPDHLQKPLEAFLAWGSKQIAEYFAARLPHLTPPVLEAIPGQKYIKVIRRAPGSQTGSVYCFVAREDGDNRSVGCVKAGDVLKAASGARPARGVRGSILAPTPEGYGCGVYGADYRR